MTVGCDAASFWHQTPRTLRIVFKAKARLAEVEHNQRAWLAWHTAALQRAKKLPRLETMLAKSTTRPRQSWQEQWQVMKLFAASRERAKAQLARMQD